MPNTRAGLLRRCRADAHVPTPPRRASARVAALRNLPAISEDEPVAPPRSAAARRLEDMAAAEAAAAAPPAEAVVAAPPAVPQLPPLPMFEPRTAPPLQDATARMATDCECGVCRDIMVAPHALACGHTFCGSCITMWVRRRAICPMCRARSGKPVQGENVFKVESCLRR